MGPLLEFIFVQKAVLGLMLFNLSVNDLELEMKSMWPGFVKKPQNDISRLGNNATN